MSRRPSTRVIAAGPPRRTVLGFALALGVAPAMGRAAHAAPAGPSAAATDHGFAGTFAFPAMGDRPKLRWWVPNALMTKNEITKEIESMVAAGFGGAEVVSFDKADSSGSNVAWGSPRWKELTKHVLKVAGQYDFSIDFTLTPGWPLNLPTITDVNDPDQGAQMETDGANVDGITQSTPYSGPVPVPVFRAGAGTPKLVAVTVAKYTDKQTKTLEYSSARSLALDSVTFSDKAHDPTNAMVSFTPVDAGEYVLFGWWEYPSGNKAQGNYQIDHFGRTGAQVLIDYWDDVLIPYYGAEWKHAHGLFSDSLEFRTHLDWTHGLLDSFESRNNYDLAPYLPALYQASSRGDYLANPTPDFKFDVNTTQVRNDFYDHMTHLYVENHLEPLNDFASRNGVRLRVQPAYGKNLNMPQSALSVAVPETETLYGDDIIDFYRMQAGAVHLNRKEIYSLEAAAELHMKFVSGGQEINLQRGNGEEDAGKNQQTFHDILWHIQRGFSGGVNQVVFHGYSYNGQYDGASAVDGFASGVAWPGWEAMEFSNNWGERSPNWKHALDYTTWIARNQQVLREGVAKIDLAVYSLKYWESGELDNKKKDYDDDGLLEQSGFSYDFVDPSGFALDNAVVAKKRLDADGPAYKAVIVDDETTIPADTVRRFVEYSRHGLPIIFVGTMPSAGSYSTDGAITDDMAILLSRRNVKHVAGRNDVPGALAGLGIVPDASYGSRAKLLSYHRQTEDADLYHLYNYGDADTYPAAKTMDAVQATVTLKGQGRPYLLDAWTGKITPIAEYRANKGSVTLDMTVGANDSVIVALAKDPRFSGNPVPGPSVQHTTARVEYDQAGGLSAKSDSAGAVPVVLSDGRTVSARFGAVPSARSLSRWDLSVESWTRGSKPSESAKSTVDVGTLSVLAPWRQLPGLETASGIGTYSTEFSMKAGWADGVGAVLDLGEVTDTFRITVNGTRLAANQNDTKLDIGRYLVAGHNKIVVEVASTLFNSWIAEYELAKQPTNYGLLGPVTLTPYRWVKLP
ncbi:glycosyl hydrolase [Streptomyces griseorubiginosus]|uniref:glycosyl hydrolase n=1 Tax=Streptomyces griseorubiginosus TaxID=67304 RepID=UPI0036C3FC84